MSNNVFLDARSHADSQGRNSQEKNKIWWEALPMTYSGWNDSDRLTVDWAFVEQMFLGSNPWLTKEFHFTDFTEKRVLEIGCGYGAASCLFSKCGAYVTAVDITEAAVHITKANRSAQSLKFDVFVMDAERLDFEDGVFDFCFSWGVLHHSSNPEKAFSEISRVLKSDGRGVLMVYNKNSLRYFVKGLYWLIIKGKIFRSESLDSVQKYFTDGYYHKHYSYKELKLALMRVGLSVDTVAVTHMKKKLARILPMAIDDYS